MKHSILGKASAIAVIVIPTVLAMAGCGGSASASGGDPGDIAFVAAMAGRHIYSETSPGMVDRAHYFCDALDDGASVDELWAGVTAQGLKEHVGRDDNDRFKAEQAAILLEAVKAYCPKNQWKVDAAS